jgi:hypothetical protein
LSALYDPLHHDIGRGSDTQCCLHLKRVVPWLTLNFLGPRMSCIA